QARWLEISVKTAGDAGFTTLTPRQPLAAVPYAQRVLTGAGSSQWLTQSNGINYMGHVGVQSVPSSDISMVVGVPNGVNNNGLYVFSSSPSHAAFFVRNFATNGWGMFDDTSSRHFMAGKFGIGAQPASNSS